MFWKAKTPNEKNLSITLDKFKKATNANEQAKLLKDFENYVPDYNFIILYRFTKKLIELLVSSNPNEEPSNSVINLLFAMVQSYDIWFKKIQEESKNSANSDKNKIDDKELKKKSQDRSPYQYLIKDSSLYDRLFHLIKTLDERIIRIIEGIFGNDPFSFVDWFNGKKDIRKSTFMNLINMIIETKDRRSSILLHLLSVSRPNILASLEPIYIPIIKKFPISLVIDLMVPSKNIKKAFPLADFEKWILESQNENTLSDIQMISGIYDEIWSSETMIKILVSSKPSTKITDITWIASKQPQILDIPQNIVRDVCDSLENASNMEFTKSDDSQLERETYIFVRLYLLSLCDPERVTVESQNLIAELIKDPDPFISAAATQCLIYWVTKFNFKFKYNRAIVYSIASTAFSEEIPKSLRYLYYTALHVLGKCFPVAAAIVQADENIRFKKEYKKAIIMDNWCFPHIQKSFNLINKVKFYDYNQAKTVIDVISNYINDHIEHEYEYEYEYEYENLN